MSPNCHSKVWRESELISQVKEQMNATEPQTYRPDWAFLFKGGNAEHYNTLQQLPLCHKSSEYSYIYIKRGQKYVPKQRGSLKVIKCSGCLYSTDATKVPLILKVPLLHGNFHVSFNELWVIWWPLTFALLIKMLDGFQYIRFLSKSLNNLHKTCCLVLFPVSRQLIKQLTTCIGCLQAY